MDESTDFCRIVHFAHVERESWIVMTSLLQDYLRQCTNI